MSHKIHEIFPKRLQQARIMRGMSLESLSKSLGQTVTRQAINKYERGKMMPDSRVLLALASSLGVKVDFFFRPFSVTVEQMEFRKKSKCSGRKSDALSKRVQEELERYLEIEQISGVNDKFTIKRRHVATIADAQAWAIDIRNHFRLGIDGISNVTAVLEDNGVKIIEVKEESGFDGLSGYANGIIPIIVVNANFLPERKRFTLLHELGHLVMSFPDGTLHKDIEKMCNAFANEMLLPFSILSANIGVKRHDISLEELRDIQLQFGISIDAIMFSLHQHGVISDNRYKTYHVKKNRSPEFKEKAEKSRYIEKGSGRFLRMVYRALADEIISVSKAAVLLNQSVDNVNAHLQLV